MTGEARQFEAVLQRIVQTALEQFQDLPDTDLNRQLELPESNTAFALATHLIGSAEYWVLEVAGGYNVQRDRLAEFHATGSGTDLVERYHRWLTAMHEVLNVLPNEQLEQPARINPRFHPSLEDKPMTVREALLHAVEHCAIHQGHLELTRQLLGYSPAGRP
jgi:uncharacterized damage-inducible protein DinB